MIKKKERERMAGIIYNDMTNQLNELIRRVEEKNLNPAYFLAFQIGLQSDIEDSLKKCRIERRDAQ